MRTFISVFCLNLIWNSISVLANVEKAIFLTPSIETSPGNYSYFDDLYLDHLSPLKRNIRHGIAAVFPNTTYPRGVETWYLLKGLEEKRRYEVRICWAATQPTSFTLDTFDSVEVLKTPFLLDAITFYSESHQLASEKSHRSSPWLESSPDTLSISEPAGSITLLLRILAAADYYTTNSSLMRSVPLVNVEIILDPYFLNIFPSSLLPVALYLIIVAIGAWYLSDLVWLSLHQLSQTDRPTSSPSPDIKTPTGKKEN